MPKSINSCLNSDHLEIPLGMSNIKKGCTKIQENFISTQKCGAHDLGGKFQSILESYRGKIKSEIWCT